MAARRTSSLGTRLPEKIGEKQLTVRRTELDALVDLPVLLRLADQGKIQTSEKTSLPGSATLRLLTEYLANGDFYRPPGGNPDSGTGPLKLGFGVTV